VACAWRSAEGLHSAAPRHPQIAPPDAAGNATLAKAHFTVLAISLRTHGDSTDKITTMAGIITIDGSQGEGGGQVLRTRGPSLHSATHLEILRRFLELDIQVEQDGPDDRLVRIG